MREGIEIALIAAGSGLLGAAVSIAGGIAGSMLTAKSTKQTTADTIAGNSADVRAQIKATADATRSQIDAALTTVTTQIQADQEHRLWERQAKTYVDVLAAVVYRQQRRYIGSAALAQGPAISDEAAKRVMESYQQPDWHELEARQQAFGSGAVLN
jgi:hypothetical protein